MEVVWNNTTCYRAGHSVLLHQVFGTVYYSTC